MLSIFLLRLSFFPLSFDLFFFFFSCLLPFHFPLFPSPVFSLFFFISFLLRVLPLFPSPFLSFFSLFFFSPPISRCIFPYSLLNTLSLIPASHSPKLLPLFACMFFSLPLFHLYHVYAGGHLLPSFAISSRSLIWLSISAASWVSAAVQDDMYCSKHKFDSGG